MFHSVASEFLSPIDDGIKIVVAGKGLSDFIRECDRGNRVFFVTDRQDAL